MTKACCPGSFDPITRGHLDVIERASTFFDGVIVGVSEAPSNPAKRPLFTTNERIELIRDVTSHVKGVEVTAFKGLLVEFCRQIGAHVVVKGLRAVTDFDYEMQMAQMNAKMGIETVFLPASPEFSYLSSSLMKEVVSLGGDINGLVPEVVEKRLKEKLGP
ncbi:MAG: pantetheine-phosphate adenylyltransferase [Actinomycetota bacterium]